LVGAFLIPAGAFNLRGWWVFVSPPFGATLLALGLLILPILGKITRKQKPL